MSNPTSTQPSGATFAAISASDLRDRLARADEIAVIDVREGGRHAGDGHILLSVSLPLSQLELRVATLIPRLATDIVVYDGGEGDLAVRATRRLAELGYTRVFTLIGGSRAWQAAGYELFTGSNVLGKAFGEFAEHVYGTPHLSALEVKRRIDAGENIVVLDSRPEPEFLSFSIPGAIDLPGAELVYRFRQAVPDPDALVVVNCAGRTRSIIGAQALINAGVPNRVASLANGTMDWLLEGFSLQSGVANLAPRPGADALDAARTAARHLEQRFELKLIDQAALAAFEREAADGLRSLYLLDVRTEEEFEAGHCPGSRWAPGGQLVQQTGEWVATQNSRIVLIDGPDRVRAAITASWLAQINWAEVFVLSGGLEGQVETGPAPRRLAAPAPAVDHVSASELQSLLVADTAIVFDLDPSTAFNVGHIPGARFAIRSRLTDDLPADSATIVLTSSDGVLAAFAAADISRATGRTVRVLAGGTEAWRAAGLALSTEPHPQSHPREDLWLSPYQREDRFAAFRAYLRWEIGLLDQLDRDRTARFRTYPASIGHARAAE
ncbi:rhodanese-like domain-containing protein [Vineibacter terrae]|uniref:rhodanese-like domain-containing protein n=1 Tax=Vineibacter terrae TaxID=2586908 RepID=UPI002E32D82D|nr:rhodanese-like domain-containing protein [Vineibacter terrae]HEX2885477.1 rhodanese-like domain-containing protein [Vineibacter terrae]